MRKKTVATTGEERTTGIHEGSNGHDDRNIGQEGTPEAGHGRLILLLIRSKMRYAAAFFAVVLTTTAGAGQAAWAQAKGETQPENRVLYINAPMVSVPQAREAASTAEAYRDSDDPEVKLALYWATGNGESPAPEDVAVTRSLASGGSPPEEPGSAITPEDAEQAGQVYLAQIGVPPDAGGAEGGAELADAGPVRPELGDGTVVAEDPEEATDESPGGGEAPAGKIPYSSQNDEPELAEGPAPGPSSLSRDEETADVGPYGFGGMSGSATEPEADAGVPEIAGTPDEPQTDDGQTTETELAGDSGDDMEEIAAIGPVSDVGEEEEDSTAYGPIGDTEQVPTGLAPSEEEPQDAVHTEDDSQDVPEDELADGGDASEGEEPEYHATPIAEPPADDPEGASEDELAQVEDPQYYAPPADDPATADEGADEVAQADPPAEEDAGSQTYGENTPSGLGDEGSTETSSSYQLVVVSQNSSTEVVEDSSSTPDGTLPEDADPEDVLSQQEDPVVIADTLADPGAADEADFQALGQDPRGSPDPAGEESDQGSDPDGEARQEGDPGETTLQGAPPAEPGGSSTGSPTEQGEPAGGSDPPNATAGNDTVELVVANPGVQDDTTAEEPTADTDPGEELSSGEQGSDAGLDVGDYANHHSGPDIAGDSSVEPGHTGGQAHGPDSGTRPAGEVPSGEPPTQAGPSGNSPGEPTAEKPDADDAVPSDPPKNHGGRNDGDGENRDPVEVAERTGAGARVERIKDTDGGAGVRQGERHPDRLPDIRAERRAEREAQRAAYLEQQRAERRAEREAAVETQQRAERKAEQQAAREAAAEEARQERIAQREAAREQEAYQQRRAAEQAAQERAEQAAAREQAAEAQTNAQPAPAVPQRTGPVYQEPAPQVPRQQLDPAPQVPTRRSAPAFAPAQAAAPAQQVQHDGGVQANQLTKSTNR